MRGVSQYSGGAGSGLPSTYAGLNTRLASKDIDGVINAINTDISLIAIPGGQYYRQCKLVIVNRNPGLVNIRLAHSPIGAAVADDDYIYYDHELAGNETIEVDIDGLIPTNEIIVRSDTTNVGFLLTGKQYPSVGNRRLNSLEIDGVINLTNTDYVAHLTAAGETGIVGFMVCNRNAGIDAYVRVAITDSNAGGAVQGGVPGLDLQIDDYVLYDALVSQLDTLFFPTDICLSENNLLTIRSDTDDVDIQIWGI